MKSQPKLPWCKKVVAKNLKKGHVEKDVKSKWVPRSSAVDVTKIFNNDDQAKNRNCCLPTITFCNFFNTKGVLVGILIIAKILKKCVAAKFVSREAFITSQS